MEISGSHRIPASREAVWAALEDLEIVKACLPGCQRLEETSPDHYEGVVATKIGPVRATFSGSVERVARDAPNGFSLVAEGDAADAGSAKGRTDVRLTDEDGDTVVTYAGQADVLGKIGQLGSRLLTGVARQTIEGFFVQLASLAENGALSPGSVTETPPLAPEAPAETPAEIEDAPPLAATVTQPTPIAPTAAPEIVEPTAVAAAAETAGPPSAGAGAVTRIMVVALVVAVIGALAYYIIWQAPN